MSKLVGVVLLAVFGYMANVQAASTNLFGADALNFTLAGNGATSVKGWNTSFGLNAGLSLEGVLVSPLEVGVRQGIGLVDNRDVRGDTALFADFNVPVSKRLTAFVGADIGDVYGQGVNNTVFAGPEAGLKLFVVEKTYIYGRVNYDFQLTDRSGTDRDSLRYTVGVGIKF